MLVKIQFATSIAVASLLYMGSAIPVHAAYLDPGAGSMLLQLLLGGFAGILVLAKLFWGRFLRVLGFRKQCPPSETEWDTSENE